MELMCLKGVIPGGSADDSHQAKILKLRRPQSFGKALDSLQAGKGRGGLSGIEGYFWLAIQVWHSLLEGRTSPS